MGKKLLKKIGAENLDESIDTNWQHLDLDPLPYKPLSEPDGYLFSFGSANLSNPTTSANNWTYNSHFYVARQGNGKIKLDSYIGSATIGAQVVFKMDKSLFPHHPTPDDPVFNNLPKRKKKLLKKYFKK